MYDSALRFLVVQDGEIVPVPDTWLEPAALPAPLPVEK
jgi:hypothetical protein